MNAYVKLKDIDSVITIDKISVIKRVSEQTEELKDFSSIQFFSNYYYIFIGSSMLHVWGNKIEYVYFA